MLTSNSAKAALELLLRVLSQVEIDGVLLLRVLCQVETGGV